MGGSAKKIANTVGRGTSAVFTLGGSEIARNNLSQKNVLNQALNAPGSIITGGQSTYANPLNPGKEMTGSGTNSDPFYIDPAAIAADQAAIRGLGDEQYAELNNWNTNDQSNREGARQKLAEALTKQGQASFQQGLPATEEMLNSQHLLNGSGLGQEIARQQGNLATNIANQVGVQGANDINHMSDVGLAALQAKQGMGNAALSRGFSLNDFINQANVAKSIGASAAPQVGNGKGQTGTLLSGIGSVMSPTASLIGKAGKSAYDWHDAQSDPKTGKG